MHFINNTTLVYGCGNTLTFMLSDGTHVRSLPSEGRGVGPIAVCPKMGLVAYAESTLQPKLFMLKYPDCSLVNTLRGLYAKLIPFMVGSKILKYRTSPWKVDQCTN